MKKKLEFYYDFGSPTAYIAWTQLPKIISEANAELLYIPILLGGVFKATGNASPAFIPAKGKYMGSDLKRYAKKYGIQFKQNSFFPINTLNLMRGAIAAETLGISDKYIKVIFRAIWEEDLNMGDLNVLTKKLEENNIEADEIVSLTQSDKIKNILKENTEKAVERGVFGAPTFFIGKDMFFGQDRLDWVKEYLS
tara:strand:- start:200 stop:784 length:585 start_codon:yes stop_codon:yes gene_type:complete